MRLRQLESFVVLAEQLHFGRAAELLHLSQPALSRQIEQLERELGVQLLRRSRRRVELTEAGAAYRDGLRAALAGLSDAARTARLLDRGEVGQLRVGHVDSAAYDLLPAGLRRLRRGFPAVRAVLVESTSAAVVDGLYDRTLDVGLVRTAVAGDDLEDLLLLAEPFVAALHVDHRLAGEASILPAALAEDDVAIVERDHAPEVHDRVLAICRSAGFSPSLVYWAAPLASTLPLVGAGLASALVPLGLSRHLSVPGVAYVPLEGAATTVDLRATWRRGDTAPLVTRFVAVLSEVAGEVDLSG